MSDWNEIEVVDSHTEGEPTRVVVAGAPFLGNGTAVEQLAVLQTQYDHLRQALILEPRGSDVLVGALLLEPSDASCAARVLFFDNVKCIGMCGHGTIGLVRTLAHLGRISHGVHRIETPVGVVTAQLHESGAVTIQNVPSYRSAANVAVQVEGVGEVVGDVVWGGNWFYIVRTHGQQLTASSVDILTDFAWKIRLAINAGGHPEVDHVVLLSPLETSRHRSVYSFPIARMQRNFVLCPGKAYDRSPCGTGTSAILACMAADGQLAPGQSLLQESIIESHFIGSFRWVDEAKGMIEPSITGRAYVTSQSKLFFQKDDPFRYGIVNTFDAP